MTASTDTPRLDGSFRQRVPGRDARTAREAADHAVARHSVTIGLCGARVELPPPEQLAFLAGVGALAAFEIIEWPVALVLGVGHQLAHSHHGRMLREFGEALEEA
ncbi:hypothetical protein ACL02U_27110 [Streptomyces sp. MS06]|uniref:hypothetical protein n=1 Tax=Streptomyces sp. MS06 TaxID=3385974 RepID=UPI0039A060BA